MRTAYSILATAALLVPTRFPAAQTSSQAWQLCHRDDPSITADLQIAACTRVIQLGGESVDDLAKAFYNRGNAYRATADYDQAIHDYGQAIRLDPSFSGAFLNRGVTYYAKKDYDRAIADFDQAIRLDLTEPYSFNNRGNAYRAKKDYDRAIADFDQAIRLNPNYANAFNNRGLVYDFKKDYDRAIADFDQAIRLNPGEPYYLTNRGSAYRHEKNYDRAIADFDQALRLNPSYATAFYNRGNVYNDKKDYDRAIADLDQAIRLNPNDADAFENRGNVYAHKGDFVHAIADLDHGILLRPLYASFAERGIVHFIRGDFRLAQRDETLALRENPPDAYPAIWLYLAQAKNGENGRPQLASHSSVLKLADWPEPVVELYLGRISPEAVLSSTEGGSESRRCGADFYLGERALLLGSKPEAARLFRAAIATKATGALEYHAAVAELARNQLPH